MTKDEVITMMISGRLLLIIDDSPLSPLPQDTLTPVSGDEQDYLISLLEKLKVSPDTAQAKFIPSLGTEGNYGLDDPSTVRDDELLASMQAYFLGCMRNKGIELSNCDVLFIHAREEMSELLAVLLLPYRVAPAHNFLKDEDGTRAELIGTYHLPPNSASVPGMILRKSDSLCYIHDMPITVNGEKKRLFRDLLYTFEEKKTVKEVVKAVEDTVRELTPNLPPREQATLVKQALNSSIEESGSIDIGRIGETIFSDAPQQMEVFTQQISEVGVQEITPVPKRESIASLEKMRVTTDNGISISLPLNIAQDPEAFEIEDHEDGTHSIILRNIGKIKTK